MNKNDMKRENIEMYIQTKANRQNDSRTTFNRPFVYILSTFDAFMYNNTVAR